MLTENKMKNEQSDSRRQFVKKAVYVVPAILTLQAAPAYTKVGSTNSTTRRERLENVQERVQTLRDQLKERIQVKVENRKG